MSHPPSRVQFPYFLDRIIGGLIVGFAICPGLPFSLFFLGPADYREAVRQNPDIPPIIFNEGPPYLVELMLAHMICGMAIFASGRVGLIVGFWLGLGIFATSALVTVPIGLPLALLTSAYVPLRLSGRVGSKDDSAVADG